MVSERVTGVARSALAYLAARVPARRHAVVYGWPDHEGNSIEITRRLLERYPGKVHLILHDPSSAPGLLGPAADHPRLVVIRKSSVRGLLAFLTAEITFTTHGVYGTPRMGRGKIVVNLWHGDGPKKTETPQVDLPQNYDLVVAGTALWGEMKRHDFNLPDGRVILSGNPRIDQFERPATREQLGKLGVQEGESLILWMPTYRAARSAAGHAWQDTSPLAEHARLRAEMHDIVLAASERGVRFMAKAHPLDVDRLEQLGVPCIRDEDLRRTGTSLYPLLAASAALITDYSSVWTDYLALDRPLGFYMPDYESYRENRGLNVPDYEAVLPGPVLRTADDFAQFFTDLPSGGSWESTRKSSIQRIGAVTSLGASDRCLDLVGEWLSARGAGPRLGGKVHS